MGDTVDALLSENGTLHRSDILNVLLAKGVMGTEKDPMAHLAAFLSDSRDKFQSDGKGNFSLRQQGQPELPPADSMRDAGSVGADEAAPNAAPPETITTERSSS